MSKLIAVAATAVVITQPAFAQPDAALCDIQAVTRFGGAGGITAYAIGTTLANLGDANLAIAFATPAHPVVAQNMYRLHEGRFEQIGMSWVKHEFCALQLGSPCAESACVPAGGGCPPALGPGCQYPSTASRNGGQSILGPRWQVNPSSGVFPIPFDGQGETGDVIFKRLQVHDADLAVPAAIHFVEGIFVAADDAAAGNQANNASYRVVSIGAGPMFQINLVPGEPTEFDRAAIHAWRTHGLGLGQPDPAVHIQEVAVPGDGLFLSGSRTSDNGDGTWHYEYAIENLSSHRAARAFTVPIGAGVTVTGAGFHDVDYHSGDGEGGGQNFDGTDWPASAGVGPAGAVTWSTESLPENPNANALRWGTLYNFRFDADAPPTDAEATIALFRPGDPASATVIVAGPSDNPAACPFDLDGDGAVGITDLLELLGAWGSPWTIGDLLDLLAAWGKC